MVKLGKYVYIVLFQYGIVPDMQHDLIALDHNKIEAEPTEDGSSTSSCIEY